MRRTARVWPIAMGRPVSAMGVRRPAHRRRDYRGFEGRAPPPEPVEERVSLRAEQAARDNPVWRRVLPDRVGSGRTVAAKVCKDVRVDRAAGRRV